MPIYQPQSFPNLSVSSSSSLVEMYLDIGCTPTTPGLPKESHFSQIRTHHISEVPQLHPAGPKTPHFNFRSQEIKGRRNKGQKYLNQISWGTPYTPRTRMNHWIDARVVKSVFQDKLQSFLTSELKPKAHSKLLHSSVCSWPMH